MKKKILLSAGIHPEEEAGVFCLERIKNNLLPYEEFVNLSVSIIALRNEQGFCIERIIKNNRLNVKYENEHLILMECDGCKYLFIKNLDALTGKNVWEYINNFLSEISFRGIINVISNRQKERIHCNTYYYINENFIDINSYNPEIDKHIPYSRNNIIGENIYDVWIDLHESIGKDFFLYIDPSDRYMLQLAKRIVNFCREKGFSIRLTANDRSKIEDGIFDIGFMKNRNNQTSCSEMIMEMGIDDELDERINRYENIIIFSLSLINCEM